MTTVRGAHYLWHMPSYPYDQVLSVAAQYNISVPIGQVLIERGYTTPDAIDRYLFVRAETEVSSASLLKDAEKAVDRLLFAIKHNEKILIAGDYDVDGITSSSLLMICLMPLGAHINFFLPHRMRDGYGLSTKVVERAAQNGYKVLITVDNGITAFEPALQAKKHGIDLIITDHHKPHATVPEAFAIVNPHQSDCPYPYKKFAGVGVGFKLMSLLYEKLGKPLPTKAYELLLLGTVADVVPLTGENRYWVRHGLRYINQQESLSLRVLKTNGKVIKPRLSATDIGFSIAPQINALGRLEDPRQGVRFLIGTDSVEVEQVGRVLLELNQTRKEIERTIFADVQAEIEQGTIDLEKEKVIIASNTQWLPGVIGLVASRLVGAYNRPAILLHLTKDGIAKGSCRSIPAFNIFEALQSARHLLTSFGGHTMAAGLALPIENIPAFKQHLEELASAQLTPADLQKTVKIDATLTLSEVNKKLVVDMGHLEPFGHENPQPIFSISNVQLLKAPQLLKDAHVKAQLFSEGIIKPIIFFNRPELFEVLQAKAAEPFNIAVGVTENYWQEQSSIELIGHDIAV